MHMWSTCAPAMHACARLRAAVGGFAPRRSCASRGRERGAAAQVAALVAAGPEPAARAPAELSGGADPLRLRLAAELDAGGSALRLRCELTNRLTAEVRGVGLRRAPRPRLCPALLLCPCRAATPGALRCALRARPSAGRAAPARRAVLARRECPPPSRAPSRRRPDGRRRRGARLALGGPLVADVRLPPAHRFPPLPAGETAAWDVSFRVAAFGALRVQPLLTLPAQSAVLPGAPRARLRAARRRPRRAARAARRPRAARAGPPAPLLLARGVRGPSAEPRR